MIRTTFTIIICLLAPTFVSAQQETAAWRDTLAQVANAVVSIRVDSPRPFDTDWNQSSQATGFVVDAERGLILTNRHVVTTGPVVADAVFVNQEEVELTAVYRDPVHDFGFFKYDPSKLKFIQPRALPLRPDLARVGREIRVVGNDAGEQISILAGTIARLDRPAPDYGVGRYNDFNTFYIQAASNTSGGSSGSPVIDVNGNAVALNAGGSSGAASSFYLPLNRVKRVLSLLQRDAEVERGTLQTVFRHRPYDELRRLGLSENSEKRMRKALPNSRGLLLVAEVVPGGPGADHFQIGDMVLTVNGRALNDFVNLEAIFDARVGQAVDIKIERAGELMQLQIPVMNLHSITPAEYIYISNAMLHELSYQQARHFNLAVEGIYLAYGGYMFGRAGVPRGAILTEFNGVELSNLDDLEQALTEVADGETVTVRYITAVNPKFSAVATVTADWLWYPASRCQRDDQLGWWPCRKLNSDADAPAPEPAVVDGLSVRGRVLSAVLPSLVFVEFDMPHAVEGVAEPNYYGTGVVVDHERGWVVTDRNTVPVPMGDVRLTFAGTTTVNGEILYVHPLHNLVVIQYDSSLLTGEVRSASFREKPAKRGEKVSVIGIEPSHQWFEQTGQVANWEPMHPPLSRNTRFQDRNLDVLRLDSLPPASDGVVADRNGELVALWSSFAFSGDGGLSQSNHGMPASVVGDMLSQLREQRPLYSLEIDWSPTSISSARERGLPENWVSELTRIGGERRQVLSVGRVLADAPSIDQLQPGDLLLAVDDQVVTRFIDVERASQKASVELTIWRDDQMLELDVATVALESTGANRILLWGGAILHEPHRAVREISSRYPTGAYVAYYSYGSPASRFGLKAGQRVIEVNGQAINNLADLADVAADFRHGDTVRLKLVRWNDQLSVISMRLDDHYWPVYELSLVDGQWHRKNGYSDE
ncbi:MAG: PDZ domain-containing protein [Gammaproteobacteria bacterium]|nr:PDZ domain-containing protein [Gammaproteobacteria bacterium]